MLAHELRNPLAPIRTELELIRVAGNTTASVERVRTTMECQVGHMVRLIDDLLDVSRITSGKIQLQRKPTPLAELVNNAIEPNRAALDVARIQLHQDLPDQPWVVDVDPTNDCDDPADRELAVHDPYRRRRIAAMTVLRAGAGRPAFEASEGPRSRSRTRQLGIDSPPGPLQQRQQTHARAATPDEPGREMVSGPGETPRTLTLNHSYRRVDTSVTNSPPTTVLWFLLTPDVIAI